MQDDAHLSTWKLSPRKPSDPILENGKVSLGYQPCPTLLIVPHCWPTDWLFKRMQSSLMTSAFLCVWYLVSLLIFLQLIKNTDQWVESFMKRVHYVKIKCEQLLFVGKKKSWGKCPAPWKWVLYRNCTRDMECTRTGCFYRGWSGLE